jgi:hypothetical protein
MTADTPRAIAVTALAGALAIGIALRLAWPEAIEWKGDEQWFFARAIGTGVEHPWSWTGMTMSVGLPAHGFSTWMFVALAWLFGASTPVGLARAVQITNCTALVLLWVVIVRATPAEERERWLWALALYALNPVAIILERKIWNISLFPIFTTLLLWGWLCRGTASGAFLWGVTGAVMGLAHPIGWVVAYVIALWSAIADQRTVAWRWWFAGSLIGALPTIPWAVELLAASGASPPRLSTGGRWFNFTLYLRWILQPFGFGAEYTLGVRPEFVRFLSWPQIGGVATWGVAMLHAILGGVAVTILARAGLRSRHDPIPVGEWFIGRRSADALLVNAVFWGYLGICSITTLPVHRHYLIPVHIVMALWVVRLAFLAGAAAPTVTWTRRLLLVVCVCEGVIATALLNYIDTIGVIQGEFGTTWGAQQRGAPAR